MRFASLGSGSQGNALLVEAHTTRVLLDCGFGLAETTRRLARIGVAPSDLSAIVVTHEHQDHIGGAARFARKHGLPVWLTAGTLRGLEGLFDPDVEVRLIRGYSSFSIGDICIDPFPVPHDAREPAQYVFGDGACRLGVLTDAGHVTPHMRHCLSGCDALVLECNHDAEMLRTGAYPELLKARISSRLGHLDNEAAAGLLAGLDLSQLQHVVAAHMSVSNNRPELARNALAAALGCAAHWIEVADQQAGLGWRQLA
ncbi:MAG TPA: MBL fold metallo-hydrolase [Burkholderiales bacterium]|nr:MBL fold metallo-hydrolase [Burkholderiales bacterium]